MSLSIAPTLRVGAKTHVGKVRSENQDRMSRFTSPLGEVFIVADGMGGHQGGLTAVVMTVDGFDTFLRNAVPQNSIPEALQTAAKKTNERLYRLASSSDPATAKMGSTVVLTLIAGDQMWIGHAGDSRAYLYRNGELTRLTKDHSMVQKMIDHEMLTEEQARNHPDASVISRAFGQQPDLELEISGPLTMRAGDGVLLCTDGLSGYARDEQIAGVIAVNRDAQEITSGLIDLALSLGGEDNVTVQYILFTTTDEKTPLAVDDTVLIEPQAKVGPKVEPAKPERFSFVVSVLLLVGAVVLGVLLGFVVARGIGFFGAFGGSDNLVPAPTPTPEPRRRETPTPTSTPEKQKEEERPTQQKEEGLKPSTTPASPSPGTN